MIWYRVTLCLAFCLLQYAPSESRPSTEPVAPAKPSDDVSEEDDYTTVLVEAHILLHVYENGTVTESDASQTTTIVLDGEVEQALTGANSTFTVVNTNDSRLEGNIAGDQNSNDTVTTLLLTATIQAEIPKTDNVTATADTTVTFVSQDFNKTDTLSSEASINGGIVDDDNSDESSIKQVLEESLKPTEAIVLSNDGSSIIMQVNIQLDSCNETVSIETDLINTALVTINNGNVTVSTGSVTKSDVTANDEDKANSERNDKTKEKTLGQDKASEDKQLDDTATKDTPEENKSDEAIVTTSTQAITVISSNNDAEEGNGDGAQENPCEAEASLPV